MSIVNNTSMYFIQKKTFKWQLVAIIRPYILGDNYDFCGVGSLSWGRGLSSIWGVAFFKRKTRFIHKVYEYTKIYNFMYEYLLLILTNISLLYLLRFSSRWWVGLRAHLQGDLASGPVETRARVPQLLWDRQRTRVFRRSRGPRASLLLRGRAAGTGVPRPASGHGAHHCFRARLLRCVHSDEQSWCGARCGPTSYARGWSAGGLLGTVLRHDATQAKVSKPNMILGLTDWKIVFL